MHPTFSIVIPIYNGMPYLKMCIESVLRQSFRQFDIWVLDSGSTDDSSAYIQSIKDERLHWVGTDKRLSITENWQRILQLPLAEYATILGQDDVLDAGFLQRMHALVGEQPGAGLYTSAFRFIDQRSEKIRSCKPMAGEYDSAESLRSMLRLETDIMATGYVFRTADYKSIGGIPLYPNLLYSDYALWIGLAQKGSLAVAPEELFSFRIHSNTSQTTKGLLYLEALECFCNYLGQLVQSDEHLRRIISENIGGYVTHYGQMIVHRVLGTAADLRQGETVKSVIGRLNACIAKLGGPVPPGVASRPSIRLAVWLDAVPPLRWLFRQWKAMQH